MDGLLLNTEDIYTSCANAVLARHGNREPLPWSLKAKLMGVPGSSMGPVFHAWAQLPISQEQWAREQAEEQERQFPSAEPLPGVERLLDEVGRARTKGKGKKVEVALASSSAAKTFALKTSRPEVNQLFDVFRPDRLILGDDPRLVRGRGKPRPDIYLLALRAINASRRSRGLLGDIRPEECLVFEDAVPGVEAGRRAGMRVVWVPHPGLAAEYRGREGEVLAGKIGLVDIEADGLGSGSEGNGKVGEVGDGWAETLGSLEDFEWERYGIELNEDEDAKEAVEKK